jgi:hypothetical protein
MEISTTTTKSKSIKKEKEKKRKESFPSVYVLIMSFFLSIFNKNFHFGEKPKVFSASFD